MACLWLWIGGCLLAQAQVTKLNGPLARDGGAGGGDVAAMQVTPDGSWAVYYADADTNEVFEIYSRPTDGSAPARKLSSGGDARVYDSPNFAIAPNGSRVVYRDDPATPGVRELFSAPIDGSAPAVRLNVPIGGSQMVAWSVLFTP